MQLGGYVHRMLRRGRCALAHQAAIPGNTGLDLGLVRGVEPHNAPAPAKASDRQARGVATVARGPGHRGVQVGHHLGVGHFGHHFGHQLAHIGVLGGVALARHQVWRNSHIAQAGEAARHVGNVLVQTKNFGDHQHHRCIFGV